MLTISRKSWHGRWFLFCNDVWAEFTDGKGARTDQTNLCIYFWVTVAAPIAVIMFHAIVLGFIGYVLYYSLLRLTFSGVIGEAFIVGLIIGIIFVLSRGFNWLLHRMDEKASNKEVEPYEEKGDSWIVLVWKYLVSVKRKVCPIIVLQESETENLQ